MTPREQALEAVRDELELFCATSLQVKPKVGRNVPFLWNKAQRYVHARIEKQIEDQGYVRVLILKGRQQGISTYVGARFYHQTSLRKSMGAFIVAHEAKATNNLYSMVQRYHQWNPLAPSNKASNAQELIFGQLDSGYKLATAGSEDVGRSNTAQLLHGSEFAFWRDAQKHMAGLGNTIADLPGTEVILESTGNGLGNPFHEMWQKAEAGEGDYIAIFVPWFWEEGYSTKVREGFTLSRDDERYMTTFKLTLEQMQWRALKIATYGTGHEWLFDQEYPATPALAFQSSTMNPLISPLSVMTAVNDRSPLDIRAPLIIGVDPAEEGKDRTSLAFRMGRTCFRIDYHSKMKPMEIAGLIGRLWKEGIFIKGQLRRPDGIFIDKIGIGAGIYDRCKELNIPVVGVNSASRAKQPDLYENRRAEMWWEMRDWIEDEPCRLPNDAALISDLSAPQPKQSSNSRHLLEKKDDMRKRGMRSPDGGDALALTFYSDVERRDDADNFNQSHKPATAAGY